MYFDYNFQSVPLLIFFINGLIFSILLLKKGIEDESGANIWLSIFIFFCSLYLCPWMCGHARWYFVEPYRQILFYVPTMQVFLLGPVIYFYTQNLLNPAFRLGWAGFLHLLPALAYMVYSLVVVVTDKWVLDEPYFYADGRDKDLDDWYQRLGWIWMTTYALLSILHYNRYRKRIFQSLSFADSVTFAWIKRYLIAFLLMQALLGVFLFLYPEWGNFSNKWWYYFFFSVLSFYIALQGYIHAHQITFSFGFSEDNPENIFDNESAKENILASQSFEKTTLNFDEWKPQLLTLLETEHLYENPRLALSDLAERLETNSTTISRVVNHCFDMNFNDLVNHYRVEAVKQMLSKGQHHKHTLLGIAYDAGFNSKTTFNRAFKKNTGLSPKEYLEKMVS
ncbi:MAG: AraC family transcriptional regulator [Runella slithyformis]|nr:MAG: AraC family transcriptional regulator [Runella slithyformis]TAF47292.1 MAG: AraC family transcriptional regulator [Runella slithyformis]TAF82157.1 MAG: AraC family transcriptional regulator [Runella slithyformis]